MVNVTDLSEAKISSSVSVPKHSSYTYLSLRFPQRWKIVTLPVVGEYRRFGGLYSPLFRVEVYRFKFKLLCD
jgi:hypothetical protein